MLPQIAKQKIKDNLKTLEKYKGKLGESADTLYNCYRLYESTLEIYEKFYQEPLMYLTK